MNLTMLVGYYPPEKTADTRLNQDMAESLANEGINVTVVTPFPIRNVTSEEIKGFTGKQVEVINENLSVIRVGKEGNYHQNLIVRAISLINKSILLYREARRIETDAYFVVSTPPFLGYVAILLSKKNKVFYKLQDVFPDSLVHTIGISENNIIIKFLRQLEKKVYRSVSNIITVSDDMKETIRLRCNNPEKIHVIYDWIDTEKCYPIEKKYNKLFARFNLPQNKFYVCYAGNIGHLQNVSLLIDVAKIIEHKYEDIHFVIIGDGAKKKELENLLSKSNLKNVSIFPMQPVEEIASVYSLGDIGVVSLKPKITKYALPSKTWDILSAGRPALCEIDKSSRLAEILEKNECGMSIAPGNAEDFADAIIDLYKNKKTEEMGRNGRIFIKNNLSRTKATEYYKELLLK